MSLEFVSVLTESLPLAPLVSLVAVLLVSLVEVSAVPPVAGATLLLVLVVPVPPVVGLTGVTAVELPVPAEGTLVPDPVVVEVLPVTVLLLDVPSVESVEVPGPGEALVHAAKARPDRNGRSGETKCLVLLVMGTVVTVEARSRATV